MRLNRLGAKLIAVFALVGAVMVALAVLGAPGAIVFWLMGGAYLLGVLIAVWIAIRARLRARHRRWLAANGLRGRVTIVAASSEMSINEQPVFDLVVDLEVPGQEPTPGRAPADRRQLRRPPDAPWNGPAGVRGSGRPRRSADRLVSG